jgi:hypothetical protein
MRLLSLASLVLFGLTGCLAAPPLPPAPSTPDDASGALGPSVILLLTPTSTAAATLGAVVSPDTGEPSSTRHIVVPRAQSTSSYVRYEGLRELSLSAGVASDLFGGADAGASTHVSYDVSIEQTLYLAGEQPYDARSRCCDPVGHLDPACGEHVIRAFVGSGTFRYLAQSGASSSAGFGDVEVHDGVSYQVERTRHFASALFAIEVAPSESVCATALCDARSVTGVCTRCRAVGAQSDVGAASAPAEGLLDLRCDDMPPATSARATVRGEVVVEDCYDLASATLSLSGPSLSGGVSAPMTAVDPSGSVSFVRAVDLTTSGAGSAAIALDLGDCRCGDRPARCRLDPELELAIEAVQ